MASNMWNPVEPRCEICGAELAYTKLSGSTIEDDDGRYLTVCENCLRLIVSGEFSELADLMRNNF
jgi:hypothetical protein